MWIVIILVIVCVCAYIYFTNGTKKQDTTKTKTQSVQGNAVKKENFIGITDNEKQILSKIGKKDAIMNAYSKAVAGDAHAMMFLGLAYEFDIKNSKKAFYWIEKAANKNFAQAKYVLGTYYIRGYGTEEKRTKGTQLVLSAAVDGNQDAIECCINRFKMSKKEMRDLGIPV